MDKEPQPTQPQTPPTPNTAPESPKKEVDLGSILLPKKEVHDPLNAPRAEAGALFKQEQGAQLPKTPAPQIPLPPRNDSIVQPLVTYQSDMQKYIQQNNVSNITIAAAEAERRGEKIQTPAKHTGSFLFKLGMIFLGSLLVGGAIGLVGYVIYQFKVLPPATNLQAPVIAIDEVQNIPLSPSDTHAETIERLAKARDGLSLSVGLVAQLLPISSTTTPPTALDTKLFIGLLAPTMPRELSRTLLPTLLVGVHSFDRNQPFIILKTDSYEQAFSGMLAWESTMLQDLTPLFMQPTLPIPESTATTTLATTTATTTQATTTNQTTSSTTIVYSTTTLTVPGAQTSVLQTGFVDKILENHDTRVLQTSAGEVYMLWTFLDRGTILVTTNANTLKEVIVRTHEAPIVSLPQY